MMKKFATKTIDFLSINSVKNKIITKTLPQSQLFLYFFLITMYDLVAFTQMGFSLGNTPAMWGWIEAIEVLVVSFFGFIFLFFMNGGAKGFHFLEKFFSYSFVIGIRYALLMLLFSFIPHFIDIENLSFYSVSINSLLNILMIANIAFWMK